MRKLRVGKTLFLYGRLNNKKYAIGYCKLHKCCLEKSDTLEKHCVEKGCRYYVERR